MLKKLIFFPALLLLLGTTTIISCSDSNETEKSAIDTMTDKTAQEAVDSIQTPIDKAQAVRNHEEDRLKNMEENLAGQ